MCVCLCVSVCVCVVSVWLPSALFTALGRRCLVASRECYLVGLCVCVCVFRSLLCFEHLLGSMCLLIYSFCSLFQFLKI